MLVPEFGRRDRQGAAGPSGMRMEETRKRGTIMLGTILLIVLILLLIGALPVYPYSRKWGYAPGGTLGVVVIVLIILLLMGYLH